MNNFKRAMALVLALVMTMALFAGCGKSGEQLSGGEMVEVEIIRNLLSNI